MDLTFVEHIFQCFINKNPKIQILQTSWSKVMTSEVKQRLILVTSGYGQHKRQWVKKQLYNDLKEFLLNIKFILQYQNKPYIFFLIS